MSLSDSNLYTIFISETDTIDILTNSRISSQPYNGVLFKSQNASTWTADQTQDMKFEIKRAKFTVGSSSTIELIPPKLGVTNLGWNPFNFITGSAKCRVVHPNHGMINGEIVKFTSRQIIESGSINGIPAAQIFGVNYAIANAELDAYVVTFPTVSTATGAVGGSYITATENYEFQTAMIDIAEIVPPSTSIDYQTKVINHSDAATSYSMFSKENKTFDEVKVYPSSVNYSSSEFSSGLSVFATLYASSTIDSISPVIDLSRLAMTMVSNKIDSPGLAINDTELDYYLIANATTIGATSGYPLHLTDTNSDSVLDTLIVKSSEQPTLFSTMNNNLKIGDVLKFQYTGTITSTQYMVIINKIQDSDAILYFKLEAFNGTDVLVNSGAGTTVTINWLSHFKSEYAAVGGSTHSKYVTKKINFSRPSEMLKIMFSAMIPIEADVDIYYKVGLSVADDFISSAYYKAIPTSGYAKSSVDFVDITADVEGLPAFDSVMIKLVMKSTNKSKVPRIKDFRVIACAA